MSFENFPYVNFHELNLDWIAKIAKDFLEQYTHIQQLIADGEQSLQDLTASGLTDLQEKADALEQLLQEWYNTHSEDIAQQLALAIQSMQTSRDNLIAQIGTAADAKLAQVLASIPADYSEMAQKVAGLENEKLSNLVITSNNILDSRSGENLLPSQMNGKIFYFGPGFSAAETYRRQVRYQVHIDKEDGNLDAIANKWVYADGTISSVVNVTMDADITMAANIVGIQMVCYATATESNIRFVGVYAHVADTPAPDYDRYSESVENWTEEISPISTMFNDFNYEENTYSAGLVTTALTVWGSQYPQYYQHWDLEVKEGEFYAIGGTWFASGYKPFILCYDDRVVYFPSESDPSLDTKYENIIQIPRGVNRLIVNNEFGKGAGVCGKISKLKENYWAGKKIVWFGTSIPAGNASGGGSQTANSYPVQIGKRLGAIMYNEAVGSSCVRAGSYRHATAEDPMGYGGMHAQTLFLSLSLSSTEKQQIIDEWASKWINIITFGADQVDFTDAWIEIYKNTSWDRKLTKYLTGGSVGPADLYVFDHGYNDMVQTYGATDFEETPSEYSDRRYFTGAMDFIIRKILDDNPRAKILIIGHYNNGPDAFGRGANFSGHLVCNGQKAYAERWGFPLVETWNLLGLSMNRIDNNQTPVIFARYPDHLHPSSDATGAELTRYAEALYPFVKDAR